MRISGWVWVAMGVALVGCQPETAKPVDAGSSAVASNNATAVPEPANAAANQPAPEPEPEKTPAEASNTTPNPDPALDNPGSTATAPAKPPTVAEGPKISPAATDGWEKTDVSPTKLAETLDTSLKELKSATGRFRLVLDKGKDGAGHDQGDIVIADSTRYSIDWFRSHKLGTILRVRANGTHRRELTEAGWGEIKPLSEVKSLEKLPLVKLWKDACSKLMFRPIVDGQPIWVPLVKDFQAQGYSVRTEIKSMTVNDKPRPFYRILAFKTNPKETRYEMRFDGIRMVPLTVKIEEPGKELVQWSGEWSFSQAIDPKTFNIEFSRTP